MSSAKQICGTGRRKSSVARVRIQVGNGSIIVNNKALEDYFGRKTSCMIVRKPLEVVNGLDNYNIFINVRGGGMTSQAGAISLGIARALLLENESLRSKLRAEGLLTRDARKVERKKVGKHKARKGTQYSKR